MPHTPEDIRTRLSQIFAKDGRDARFHAPGVQPETEGSIASRTRARLNAGEAPPKELVTGPDAQLASECYWLTTDQRTKVDVLTALTQAGVSDEHIGLLKLRSEQGVYIRPEAFAENPEVLLEKLSALAQKNGYQNEAPRPMERPDWLKKPGGGEHPRVKTALPGKDVNLR